MKSWTCSRRDLLLAAPLLCATRAWSAENSSAFQAVESQLHGRLGISAVNVESKRRVGYRSAERFAFCSTFKAPLAAAILAQIDAGSIDRATTIDIRGEPLLANSPVSAMHSKEGKLTVLDACEAAVSHSDNTAANGLLKLLGGPEAMTGFFRGLGDEVSRIDRYELELNSNIAGDPRDTTTPDAMMSTLARLLLGEILTVESRRLLTQWMLNEQRGKARIRAGLPSSWRVANKPGTSANGATNDIAVTWTDSRQPIALAVYVNAPAVSIQERENAIARIARLAVAQLS